MKKFAGLALVLGATVALTASAAKWGDVNPRRSVADVVRGEGFAFTNDVPQVDVGPTIAAALGQFATTGTVHRAEGLNCGGWRVEYNIDEDRWMSLDNDGEHDIYVGTLAYLSDIDNATNALMTANGAVTNAPPFTFERAGLWYGWNFYGTATGAKSAQRLSSDRPASPRAGSQWPTATLEFSYLADEWPHEHYYRYTRLKFTENGHGAEPTNEQYVAFLSDFSTNNTALVDTVTAIQKQSPIGIWDEELQVWWTPRMSNGSLTYQATTNVNLNAEN